MTHREFDFFTAKFDQEGGITGSKNRWFRHPQIAQQNKSIDVESRNMTVDYILDNTVSITPFRGPQQCCYCLDIFFATDAADIIAHLTNCHRKLKNSIFSCPSFVTVKLMSFDTYREHFRTVHSPSILLLTVCCETNVSQRLSIGFTLYSLHMVIA